MQITQILYEFWASIRDIKMSHEEEFVRNIFSLEVDTDDHFFFEKLAERLQFTLPDIRDIELLSKKCA